MIEPRQCPDCGAYLDPGEICDCQKQESNIRYDCPWESCEEGGSCDG